MFARSFEHKRRRLYQFNVWPHRHVQTFEFNAWAAFRVFPKKCNVNSNALYLVCASVVGFQLRTTSGPSTQRLTFVRVTTLQIMPLAQQSSPQIYCMLLQMLMHSGTWFPVDPEFLLYDVKITRTLRVPYFWMNESYNNSIVVLHIYICPNNCYYINFFTQNCGPPFPGQLDSIAFLAWMTLLSYYVHCPVLFRVASTCVL